MNLFVVFKQADGTFELVTPPLDGMILPGVTRDSILSLARCHAAGALRIPNLTPKLVVSERGVTMKEVCDAVQSGRLVEMFGSGKFSLSLRLTSVCLPSSRLVLNLYYRHRCDCQSCE